MMRGHSTTTATAFSLAAIALGATLTGCDPIYYGNGPRDPGPAISGDGRVAISWTLNGAPLTEAKCKDERITYVNVFILSELDVDSHVEFINVACGLDKYSVSMVPTGPLRVYVDAVRNPTGTRECLRYGGRVSVTATTQYPSTPTPIPLKLADECP